MSGTLFKQHKSLLMIALLILVVQFTFADLIDSEMIAVENRIVERSSKLASKELDDHLLKNAVDSFIRYHLLLKHRNLFNNQKKKTIEENYNILQQFLGLYSSENKNNADKLKYFIGNLLN